MAVILGLAMFAGFVGIYANEELRRLRDGNAEGPLGLGCLGATIVVAASGAAAATLALAITAWLEN